MLVARLAAELWRPTILTVTVQDGTVELWGLVRSVEEKKSRSARSSCSEGKTVAGNIVAVIASGLQAYAFTTAIAVISAMISGMAKAATVSNVLAGKSLL